MTGRQQLRLGTFGTIAAAMDYAAESDAGIRFFSPRGEAGDVLSYRALREQAIMAGCGLMALGLERGDRVAVIAETGAQFLSVFYGCQYVGLVPCPVPSIAYIGGQDAYVARIANLVRAAGARILCAPAAIRDIADLAAAQGGATAVSFGEWTADAATVHIRPFAADEIAYIQFSSGSTARPKGVPVTQRAISANAGAILQHGMKLTVDDRAFSWLPFYHDMGLVGFSIAPLFGQCAVDYLAPSSFARRPNLWTELMSSEGSTITYSPTFGYRLAAQRLSDAGRLDLSALRIAGIGGDMIREDVLEQFAAAMAPAGFRRSAFRPSYGMAEATLAISFALGLETDTVDKRAMAADGIAVPAARAEASDTRDFVICGRVLPGHDLVITGADGRALSERHVGRILVRGPSVMQGYHDAPGATAEVMQPDGFMDTGDLGYLAGDNLVVTGRVKDVIHHRGRNIWPEDIEWAAERVEPLKPGDVAAFAVAGADGDDRLVALVQSRFTDAELGEDLRQRVGAAISEAAGIICEVVLVAPRSLPITSSGKLARQAAKQSYLAGEMQPAAS